MRRQCMPGRVVCGLALFLGIDTRSHLVILLVRRVLTSGLGNSVTTRHVEMRLYLPMKRRPQTFYP